MQIQPEVIMMKDGRYIYIKTILPDPDNARALVAHTKKVLEETNYLVRYPDEYTIDAEGELRVLDTYLKSIDSFFIGAFDGDRLIGTLDGGPAKTYRRYRHRMEIGMAVQKDYWDNGIGSKLVENALCACRVRFKNIAQSGRNCRSVSASLASNISTEISNCKPVFTTTICKL